MERRQELRVANPPRERPLMVYDGACNVCRRWIATGTAPLAIASIIAHSRRSLPDFPEISRERFERAVQLIDTEGRVWNGADAVFHLFDFAPKKGWLIGLMQRIPGFMPIARVAYGFIARRRSWLSAFTRLLWGRETFERPGER
jgi:predicted DCC family thiol-disulfide oxidoreductase YuxK